ncbi:hypothetical protein RJ641_021624, partial [Dillenia turbinata]
MEQRKWEELKVDCLVNVFRRLGMETLLWIFHLYASHAPFGDKLIDRYQLKYFSITAFIKFVIGHGERCVTLVELTSCCTEEALVFVANERPALRSLALPSALLLKQSALIPKLTCKWKILEVLRLEGIFDMSSILPEISHHCNIFVELSDVVHGSEKGSDDCLKTILEGWNELVLLHVRDCIGFKETDEETLNLAAHVDVFMSEGSRTKIWCWECVDLFCICMTYNET